MNKIKLMPDWLMHHGVQGQKWGVKNGPPYPIGSGPKGGSYLGKNLQPGVSTEEQKQAYISSLQKSVADWTYGIISGGNQITNSDVIDEEMRSGRYKIAKPEDSEKSRTGICWDATAYIDKALNENYIPHRNYFWFDGNGHSHSFKIINTLKGKKWIEGSWEEHLGLHDVKGALDIVNLLEQGYNIRGWGNSWTFKYDPSGSIGKTSTEIMNNWPELFMALDGED